jgi:hypothetical protein
MAGEITYGQYRIESLKDQSYRQMYASGSNSSGSSTGVNDASNFVRYNADEALETQTVYRDLYLAGTTPVLKVTGGEIRMDDTYMQWNVNGVGSIVMAQWEDYFLDITNWATDTTLRESTVLRVSGQHLNGMEATVALVVNNDGLEFVDITNNNFSDDKFYRWRMQYGTSTGHAKSWIIDYKNYTSNVVTEAMRIDGENGTAGSYGMGNVRFAHDIGNLGTFVSGFAGSGWRMDTATETLTVDNLVVRKGMSVYELTINQIRCTNGSLWVSDAAKIDWIDDSYAGTNGMYYPCHIDTDDGNIIQPFAVGDIVRCQKWTGRGIKYYSGQVMSIGSGGDWFTIWLLDENNTGLPEAGDDLIRIGNTTDTSRQGALYLTSHDADSPYMDIIDGVTDESFLGHTKVRLGKLTGITDTSFGALSGYGLYATNAYLTGSIFTPYAGITSTGTDSTDVRIYAGNNYTNRGTAPFRVTQAGNGFLGGFTLDVSEGLYSGTGATRVQMKAGVGIWCGATAFGDATFRVAADGSVNLSSAVSGKRVSISVVNNNMILYSAATGDYIKLDTQIGAYEQPGIILTSAGTDGYYSQFTTNEMYLANNDTDHLIQFYVTNIPTTKAFMKGLAHFTGGNAYVKTLCVDTQTGEIFYNFS